MIADSVIKKARSADLVELIEARGVELSKKGGEFAGLCPFHAERTPSFTVNPVKGFYHCFGCGVHGDAIDFVMRHEGVEFHEAVQSIVGQVDASGSAPARKQLARRETKEKWRVITPVPDDAPEPTSIFRGRKSDCWEKLEVGRRWAYKDANGRLIGYVCRFDLLGGGKDVRPQSYCENTKTGERRWNWISFSKPRPIYGLDRLAQHPNAEVMIIEGEKACDAAQALYEAAGISRDKLLAIAWPGGAKAVKYVDWSPLFGRNVVLWPDADQKHYVGEHPKAGALIPFLEQPGTVSMLEIFECLKPHCQNVRFILPPAAGVADGWDLADELPGGFNLLRHTENHSMATADVKRRFSPSPSVSVVGKILPVWLVPTTDMGEIRRAVFAADVIAFFREDIADRLDPRGSQLRPYAGVEGLRVAIREVHLLLPAARLHAVVPAELGDDAVKAAHEAGASVEILQPGDSWVANLWAQAGMKEPSLVDRDDIDLGGTVEFAGQVLAQAATKTEDLTASAEQTINPAALEIADAVERKLCHAFDIDLNDTDAIRKFGIDAVVISRMIDGAFWSGSKSKVFMLNQVEALNQFHAGEAFKFLVQAFGNPVDAKTINSMIDGMDLEMRDKKELRRRTWAAVSESIIDHLKYWNQRDTVEWRTDMFASGARMSILEDKARIVLTHKPFDEPGSYEPTIIDDYKQHFSRFDEFLEFLVMSRFALDRKKCYLWILADSDWGKGFLLGVLNALGLAVGTSMKEIEAMFEGKPVGRTPEEFKRAFALVVDEFKVVKSELKQLQSEITLSPKNKLTSSVEVFAKIFLSAESVGSLVTSHGIEDQFANRMSIFQETGSLDLRPMFNDVGKPRYFNSVLAYSAETLNRLVEKMQRLGKLEAQTCAERWINRFIGSHGLDTLYERFSDSLPEMAAGVLPWVYKQENYLLQDGNGPDKRLYLTSANKVLEDYINMHFDASEAPGYRKKKPEILKRISADGRGFRSHRINGKTTKAVLLSNVDSLAGTAATGEPAF